MPNIKTYDAPALGLRPTETGIEATAAAGRRVHLAFSEAAAAQERTGHQLGSAIATAGDVAVKYIDHQQISHGALALAGLFNAKENEWNDTIKKADPNDPTVQQKFLSESLEPDLEKFKEGFTTENSQRWAQAHVDQLRQHMFRKTSSDMSAMAGEAAHVNTRQTINSLSNTVRSDPTSMDFSLQTLESTLNGVVGSSPNLTGTQAAKVRGDILQAGRESIIKSAALGYIEKTGDVPDWVTDPKYSPYIKGDELKQFQQAARYYKRLADAEDRAARVQRDYEARLDFNRKLNELEAELMPRNVGERPTVPPDGWQRLKELSKHPGAALDPGRLKSAFTQFDTLTNRMNKPEPLGPISHQTTIDLLRRIRSTDDSRLEGQDAIDAIYDAYDKGKLSTSDFRFLNTEAANLRTPDGQVLNRDRATFWKQHGPIIDTAAPELGRFAIDAGGHTELGKLRLYQAEMDARRQEEALRKAGKDPHSVYDPRSENYFGKPENLQRYRTTLQDHVNYAAQKKGVQPATTIPAPAAPAQAPPKILPPGTTPEQARKMYPSGTPIVLPDGRRGTVP